MNGQVNDQFVLKMRRWDQLGFGANAVFVHDPASTTEHVFATAEFGFLEKVSASSEHIQTCQNNLESEVSLRR